MSQINKAEMALQTETTSQFNVRVLVTKELEGINEELKTMKEKMTVLTERLEGGAAMKKEIARRMTDARKELVDLEKEKEKTRSIIAAYKEKKRQENQVRMQNFGFSLEAELSGKELGWLAQLDQL